MTPHLLIRPVNDAGRFCSYADAARWMLTKVSVSPGGASEQLTWADPRSSLGENLVLAQQPIAMEIAFSSVEQGGPLQIGPVSPGELSRSLMERVVDDTPDDVDNTDDHPLEEVRTALLDMEDMLAS
jgi:hypothetical protein